MEEAVAARQEAEKEKERYHCVRCGREITDFEDTEFTEDEQIFTYKCPECGFYGEQHFKVTYTGTEEIK